MNRSLPLLVPFALSWGVGEIAGYWFSDTDDLRVSGDLGLGHEFTEYYDSNDDTTILVARGFAEAKVFTQSKLSEELIMFPSLEDAKQYRLKNEIKFTTALTEDIAVRLSHLLEYNTDPQGNAKKSDTHLILSLVYSF